MQAIKKDNDLLVKKQLVKLHLLPFYFKKLFQPGPADMTRLRVKMLLAG
jgi:hypothetical protein